MGEEPQNLRPLGARDSLIVHPRVGVASSAFGLIKFGMTQEEVRGRLGEPDTVEGPEDPASDDDPDEADDEGVTWEYEKLGLDLSFSDDSEPRLVRASADCAEASLFGLSNLMGLTFHELIALLPGEETGPFKLDDFGESVGWKLTFPQLALGFVFYLDDGQSLKSGNLCFVTWYQPSVDHGVFYKVAKLEGKIKNLQEIVRNKENKRQVIASSGNASLIVRPKFGVASTAHWSAPTATTPSEAR